MKRLVIIVIVLLSLTGMTVYLNQHSTTAGQLVSIDGATMGTSYHIKLVAADDWTVGIDELQAKIKSRLAAIDAKMSTFKPDSDISRFNSNGGDTWITITPETMLVVNTAHKISTLTTGSFDITVGKLVNLWGFGPTVNIAAMPDPNMIETLRSQSGYRKLQIQQTPPALRKTSKELYLDLSAIAKGYAVDAVAKLLLAHNVTNFLVEIGGEIITHGNKSEQHPWVIGIESPQVEQHVVRKRLHLNNVAMATSGDYRNYFEHEGVRYSHTIDPETGYPIKHRLASVTVIDSSCMRADAIATAITVMGEDKGLAFAEAQKIAVFMLVKSDNGFIEKQSTAFNAYLEKTED